MRRIEDGLGALEVKVKVTVPAAADGAGGKKAKNPFDNPFGAAESPSPVEIEDPAKKVR